MIEAAEAPALRLPEVLDMTAAASLAEALLDRRGGPLTVDASRVQRMGAQCAQVLMSALMTWSADDLPLDLINPSPEFQDALSLLGIGLAEKETEEPAQ